MLPALRIRSCPSRSASSCEHQEALHVHDRARHPRSAVLDRGANRLIEVRADSPGYPLVAGIERVAPAGAFHRLSGSTEPARPRRSGKRRNVLSCSPPRPQTSTGTLGGLVMVSTLMSDHAHIPYANVPRCSCRPELTVVYPTNQRDFPPPVAGEVEPVLHERARAGVRVCESMSP
jgi:hypothetical protein